MSTHWEPKPTDQAAAHQQRQTAARTYRVMGISAAFLVLAAAAVALYRLEYTSPFTAGQALAAGAKALPGVFLLLAFCAVASWGGSRLGLWLTQRRQTKGPAESQTLEP